MKGNFHVQFLGGWGTAMFPGYPARLDSLDIEGLAAYLIARPFLGTTDIRRWPSPIPEHTS
jgi:hypothetical protein